jgi:hypothetical protein
MLAMIQIYSVTLLAILASCILWKALCALDSYTNHFFLPWIIRHVLYFSIIKKRPGSSSVNFLCALALLFLFGFNIFGLLYKLQAVEDLSPRSSWLFLTNLAPLYLGYKASFLTSFLTERLFLDLRYFHVVHRWLGRACFVLSMFHSLIQIIVKERRPNSIEITVCIRAS